MTLPVTDTVCEAGGTSTAPAQPATVLATADVTVWCADARTAWRSLPRGSVDAIVTSPPYYGLRDYGVPGQLGMEPTPDGYIDALADLLTNWGRHTLTAGGSLWLNLGDTYAAARRGPDGSSSRLHGTTQQRVPGTARPDVPAKSLLMIPERVALALIERGWRLRNKVVWAKPNAMPSSATDRLTCRWEYLLHLTRSARYRYDLDAIREPLAHPDAADATRVFGGANKAGRGRTGSSARTADGRSVWGARPPTGRNPGDVWTIPTTPNPAAHFAAFPAELVRRPILATVPPGGLVADPFAGTGTTAVMARRLGRRTVLVDLNPDYCRIAARRLAQDVLDLAGGCP